MRAAVRSLGQMRAQGSDLADMQRIGLAYCGNAYLSETYALHVGKIAALRTHLAVKPDHTNKSYQEHRKMLKLLRDGQLDAALGVLDTHIARTKTTYASGVEDIAAADRAADAGTDRKTMAPLPLRLRRHERQDDQEST